MTSSPDTILTLAFTRWALRRGIGFGLAAAAGLCCIALARLVIAWIVVSVSDRPGASAELLSVSVTFLPRLFAGYFVGLPAAGLLFAAASWVPWRVVRYPLIGGLVVPVVYGSVAVMADSGLGENGSPDIRSFTLSMALIGIAGGLCLAILDYRRQKAAAQRVA